MKLRQMTWRQWAIVFKPNKWWWGFSISMTIMEYLYPAPGRPRWKQVLYFWLIWMAYWVFMYLMAIITVVYRETIGNRRQKPACRAVSNNEPENFVQP